MITYYKLSPFAKNWVHTQGIKDYCEEHKCFWILDVLASYVPQLTKENDYMTVVEVRLTNTESGHMADFIMSDGNLKPFITQQIDYTDLLDDVKFWAICESHNRKYNPKAQTVVLLPEEY